MCVFAQDPVAATDTVSLVFIGDVMMHAKQLQYDCTTFLEDIRPRLEKADVAVANMEFTLGGEPYTGYPEFSAPDGYAQYVSDCGVDVFLTANNHILDRGMKGLRRTLSVYEKMGKMSKVVESKGIRIGIVNFTYGTNCPRPSDCPVRYMERDSIAADIAAVRERGADVVIAFPHWGNEYETTHSPGQEQWAEWLCSQGVDCILGAHPHVVQDTTHMPGPDGRKKIPVVYSVGNAVSNMSAKDTRLELLVTLRLVRDPGSGVVSLLEPDLTWLWCTLPGRLEDTYKTIEIEKYLGKRDLWKVPSDYDNMIQTLKRYEENHKTRSN